MAEKLDSRSYPLAPRKICDGSWFYEEAAGVIVVAEPHAYTKQVRIPWRKLEAAVDNHRKIRSARTCARSRSKKIARGE
jgi:hypothetical protein